MFKLPYIPEADTLIDSSFRLGAKASRKAKGSGKGPLDTRQMKGELNRVDAIGKKMEGDLGAIIKQFPSYEQLPPFYQKLLDLKINRDHYKKHLGAVQWAKTNLEQLRDSSRRKILRDKESSLAKQYLGRSCSILKRIDKDLVALIEIKQTLLSFPGIKDAPTIVIAGYPNVGKSTFMRTLTGSKVEISPYPFTTKELLLGYAKYLYQDIQLIDSPGLLDRPKAKRNQIELQATLALQELAEHILVIIDATQEVKPQLKLLAEMKEEFKVPITVGLNKIDIASKAQIGVWAQQLQDELVVTMCANEKQDCLILFKQIAEKIKREGEWKSPQDS